MISYFSVTLKAIVATARSSAKMDAIASAVEKLRSVQKDLEKMKKDIEEVQKDSEKAQKEVGEIIGALNSIQRQPSPPPGCKLNFFFQEPRSG
jgi:outer membrane murein-binding lipoprotein Lpp